MPSRRVGHFREVVDVVSGKADLLLVDKDDTITAYREFVLFDSSIKESLRCLEQVSIDVKVLSNGIRLGDPLTVEGVEIVKTVLKKPFNDRELKEWIGSRSMDRVWVVGDRLMTDIYLANRLGCSSILL